MSTDFHNKKILITGGAGYIGSTIASVCIDNGLTPVILDDLSTGLKQYTKDRIFYKGDIGDKNLINKIIQEQGDIWGVIHCAAKIVVPESVAKPLDYYENNVSKSVSLLQALIDNGVERFIFSSTGSMYSETPDLFVNEDSEVNPHSPYSASKRMFERILEDTANSGSIRCIALRYFNPIGADPRFRTGLQNPHPTHVLGKMIEAYNTGKVFSVTGTQWATRDGSGLRDYIHVWDIARAHFSVISKFDEVIAQSKKSNFDIINLGTGTGVTVLELLKDFETATGKQIQYVTAESRPGDVIGVATKTDKAKELLDWEAGLSIAKGIQDSIKWSEILPSILEENVTNE